MLKTASLIFGAVFIIIGILGFLPSFAPPAADGAGNLLFGLFAVNAMHNWVHLLSGIAAVVAGLHSEAGSRLYFRVFGVVYALVAVAGLFVGRGHLIGMAHNMADVALHALIAIVALYLGFAYHIRGTEDSTRHAA